LGPVPEPVPTAAATPTERFEPFSQYEQAINDDPDYEIV
jgi:hypothetical protein